MNKKEAAEEAIRRWPEMTQVILFMYQAITPHRPLTLQEEMFGRRLASKCHHLNCLDCDGTRIKKDKTECIHFIACDCTTCVPYTNLPVVQQESAHPS